MEELLKLVLKNQQIIYEKLQKLDDSVTELKLNQGRILSRNNELLSSREIKDYEFKIFSQWGGTGLFSIY